VKVVGTAMGEGAPGSGITPLGFKRPITIMNTTEIHRTPFEFSRTVLQEGLKYDKSGPYKERAKDAVIEHMVGIEARALFGKRSTTERASLTSGSETETVRTTSGIREFLQLWDAGSTGITIDGSTYAPYNHKAADTSDSDDTKRIISNSTGKFSVRDWNSWIERVNRFHSTKTDEKLVLCGSGAMLALNDMFRKSTQMMVTPDINIYGLSLTQLKTPFGNLYFLIHPLFNEWTDYRNSALILDIHSLKYRYLSNSDTTLLKNRQNNGDDKRKDEYLTEFGFEFHLPESNMWIMNLTTFVDE
jgi:hypothetical protein